MQRAALIRATGVVQGVGFRPFVYRLAVKLGLRGYVKNLGGSEVEIWVEGSELSINEFITALRARRPPPLELDEISVSWVKPNGFERFEIRSSDRKLAERSQIPPDLAICDDCLKEVLDPRSRWYKYPFNSCAWCGPRFSMIRRVPYDRENTSMSDFPLCEACLLEYRDPANERRFHAQGISCPKCGPRLKLLGTNGDEVPCKDPLSEAATLIDEGFIVAVKGIGGFHLAALASDDSVVAELRRRKERPQKPFAIMALDLDTVYKISEPRDLHLSLMVSHQRPIVLVPKRTGSPVSELVAPGLAELGIMLPYTALHYLLLNQTKDKFLIMTSGNRKGLPICRGPEALVELRGVADYFLVHNREIVNRADDSVIRLTDGEPQIIRRSRGYAPRWIKLPFNLGKEVVALGAHLDNAGAVAFENKVVPTQYVGDMEHAENVEFLESSIKFLVENYKLNPEVVASDKHPGYTTTRLADKLAREEGIPLVKVQHHHAHIASAMATHGLSTDTEVVGVAMDGIGYGDDGKLWGGEILLASYTGYQRLGHLEYLPLPGGDKAAYHPVRILAGVIARELGSEAAIKVCTSLGLDRALPGGLSELELVVKASARAPLASSVGRFLDAVSALLGVCTARTYEGEPAIKLEAAARGGSLVDRLKIDVEGDTILTSEFLMKLLDARNEYGVKDLAYTCLFRLGEAFASFISEALGDLKLPSVASGGAAVNDYIIKGLRSKLRRVLLPQGVPPGDGGIAVGQALVAALASTRHE